MERNDRTRPRSLSADRLDVHKRAKRPHHTPYDHATTLSSLTAKVEAKPPQPRPKVKYHNYIEFIENTDKKKKLAVEHIFERTPPSDFEFLPIGNPDLSACCKEMSREDDRIVYIVSAKMGPSNSFSAHMWRIGYHFHSAVLLKARSVVDPDLELNLKVEYPSTIPQTVIYHRQVNAIIRDLFPRIPNFDRQTIVGRGFTHGARYKGLKPVGLQEFVPLFRRVQLAVIAHIRHSHTDYDQLRTQMPWTVARDHIRSRCVEILCQWRGDEETGRDQVDRFARDWIFLDSDASDSSDESTDDASSDESDRPVRRLSPRQSQRTGSNCRLPFGAAADDTARKGRRGFERYRQAWDETVRRHRDAVLSNTPLLGLDDGQDDDHGIRLANAPNSQQVLNFVGNAPAPGGYVPQNPQMVQSFPGNASHPSVMVTHQMRDPVVRERAAQNPGLLAGQTLLVNPQIQNALPRPIEPTFLTYQRPCLSPIVPPRVQDKMEHHLRQSWQYCIGRPPSPAQQLRDDEHNFSCRPVMGSHGPPIDICPGNLGETGQFRLVENRDQDIYTPEDLGLATPGPNYIVRARENASANQPGAGRIVVNATRPGTGSNLVVMEDRGGFFEKVADPDDPQLSKISPTQPFDAGRWKLQVLGVSGGHPMILPENQAHSRTDAALFRACRGPPGAVRDPPSAWALGEYTVYERY